MVPGLDDFCYAEDKLRGQGAASPSRQTSRSAKLTPEGYFDSRQMYIGWVTCPFCHVCRSSLISASLLPQGFSLQADCVVAVKVINIHRSLRQNNTSHADVIAMALHEIHANERIKKHGGSSWIAIFYGGVAPALGQPFLVFEYLPYTLDHWVQWANSHLEETSEGMTERIAMVQKITYCVLKALEFLGLIDMAHCDGQSSGLFLSCLRVTLMTID